MTLPESIAVRYTEEEAGYVTIRPVVRQTFRLDELLDMILSVTAKDAARTRQILKSGTVVYHFYRYWWTGFDADESQLIAALKQFPDADPSRPFSRRQCEKAVFESDILNAKPLLGLDRAAASRRRLLRGQSFWESLMEISENAAPAYRDYSYSLRADVYGVALDSGGVSRIAQAAERLAPRNLRMALRVAADAKRILLICPR